MCKKKKIPINENFNLENTSRGSVVKRMVGLWMPADSLSTMKLS